MKRSRQNKGTKSARNCRPDETLSPIDLGDRCPTSPSNRVISPRDTLRLVPAIGSQNSSNSTKEISNHCQGNSNLTKESKGQSNCILKKLEMMKSVQSKGNSSSTSSSRNLVAPRSQTAPGKNPSSKTNKTRPKSKSKKYYTKKDACTVKFSAYGCTSQPKPALTMTGLDLSLDPYAMFHKDLHCPLRLSPGAPAWMVTATERLRDRVIAMRPATQETPEVCEEKPRQESREDVPEPGSDMVATCETHLDYWRNYFQNLAMSTREEIGDHLKSRSQTEVSEDEDQKESAADEMEDDDEEEGGLPQAVRGLRVSEYCHISHREVARERQKAMMEDIARKVPPESLLSRLTSEGFLDHKYASHSRTSNGAHNLKNGKKRQMVRLLAEIRKSKSFFS